MNNEYLSIKKIKIQYKNKRDDKDMNIPTWE